MDKTLRLAFYRIIKALMRILYRKGVALGDFTQVVKQAYVDVVEQELANVGERATTSRIAVITGLTRKDVAALRQADKDEPKPRFNRSLRVINGWLNDVAFCDAANGAPAHLPFRGEVGSFEHLVQRYSGDMSCFAMLDELKRVQLVQELPNGELALLNPVYIPHGNESEQLQLLGEDVALLVGTINHNVMCTNPHDRRYQRKVSYNNLPEEVLPEFRQFVKEDAQALLVRFNTWLHQHDRDSNPQIKGTGRMQAGVGIYYFEQPVAPEESQHES